MVGLLPAWAPMMHSRSVTRGSARRRGVPDCGPDGCEIPPIDRALPAHRRPRRNRWPTIELLVPVVPEEAPPADGYAGPARVRFRRGARLTLIDNGKPAAALLLS